jgi:hypothetical protein
VAFCAVQCDITFERNSLARAVFFVIAASLLLDLVCCKRQCSLCDERYQARSRRVHRHAPRNASRCMRANSGKLMLPRAGCCDPYVTEGLVMRWEVRKWNTVVGEQAAQPIRPA